MKHYFSLNEVDIMTALISGLNAENEKDEEFRSIIYKCKAMNIGDRFVITKR